MTDKPDCLTFQAQKEADPVGFHRSQVNGARATQEYWRTERPPAWLYDMDDREFIAWLERQEKQHGALHR